MTKTPPIASTAECEAPNSGYLRKISNTLFAALKAHTLKCRGKRVVVTNGVFDILHVGHVRFLEAAKARGDFLIVGVNSDEAVKKLKGPNRPINHQENRITLIAALECVDLVVLVNDTRVASFIEVIRPSIWAKGSDYSADTLDKGEVAAARYVKAEIALLELVAGVSTTDVIATIRGDNKKGSVKQRGRRKQ
jgi:rfaE bifunctional protein nucleotidyltransferase chain/domain